MATATQERSDVGRAGETMSNQYQSFMDGWAEVSRCCLEAADDIYQTGVEYVKEQTEQMRQIACDPASAMREETYSTFVNHSFDAADRIAQAYLHSLESVREPMMRVVSAQLPMARAMESMMEKGLQRGEEMMEKGEERMERTVRGATRSAERGIEEGQQQHQQQGRRKSA